MIVIHPPQKKITDDYVEVSAHIEADGYPDKLWFRLPAEYAESVVTERADGFLTAVLMLAMSEKQDIEIRGAVSEKLYINLTNYYMHLLTILNSSLSKIEIRPDKLDSGKAFQNGSGTIMGFSGGVDSFASMYDHHFHQGNQNYKVTHLLYNNVDKSENFEIRRRQGEKIANFATECGFPIVGIDSNIHDFCQFPFVFSFIIRNVSAALMLQKLITRFIIASSYKYQDIYVSSTYSMGFSESLTAPLLRTENLEVIVSGAQYSRVEKTALLRHMPLSKRYLDVCVSRDRPDCYKHCSKCFKCLRTQLTLEILGELESYRDLFDLDVYRKHRIGYIMRVLQRADEYDEEIFKLAKERNFQFTLFERARATPWVHILGRRVKRAFT